MTAAIMIIGPLSVVIGCLYWVLSLGEAQVTLNADLWPKITK